MADESVHVSEYEPEWPARFAEQRHRVGVVLAPWLAAPVEHIGSTAVPGLAAKPVIDMLAPVLSLGRAQDAIMPLQEAGWMFWPEDPGRPYRLWFLYPRPEARTHHLQVLQHDDPHARALIAFRDALRAEPSLRAGYAELKTELARQHPDNRNAYTNAKNEFVARVLRNAGIDPPARGRLPE